MSQAVPSSLPSPSRVGGGTGSWGAAVATSGERPETSVGASLPDEAPLDPGQDRKRHLESAGALDLSVRDWVALLKRVGKRMGDDKMPMFAQALAYSSFLAIPAVLLLALGLFTLFANQATITRTISHLGGVIPGQAQALLSGSLHRLGRQHRASLVLTIVGFLLALWSTTGAMTSFMAALNVAYEREDRRKFVAKRVTALAMVACIGVAFLLVAVLLLFGPPIERHLGRILGAEGYLKYVWWGAQWPILLAGLLAAFATLLYLGPDVDHRRWRFLSPGAVIAVVFWLVASGAFAVYTARFGHYNKTWGSLSAVIVMLLWLWFSALALLFGAEVNAEADRLRVAGVSTPDPRADG